MLNWVFGGKRSKEPAKKAPPYEQAREIAAGGTDAERTDLAKCEDLPPEFLYFFATDKNTDVRSAVASNPGTPLQADVILAKDREVAVRTVLAGKIGRLLPDIRKDQSEKLAELAFEVLEQLAEDQAVEVRRLVADSIKSLDNVPKPIVQLLARDLEDAVSMPVLEYSPLLEEQDLLNLIVTGLSGKRLAAISKREDLTSELIDAIVDTEDDIAVEALISNEGADISHRTLDSIVDASEDKESWQSALAGRVKIPKDTWLRLSKIATESVLNRMRTRSDLGVEVMAELEQAVSQKVKTSDHGEEQNASTTEENKEKEALDAAFRKAQDLHAEGKLVEARVMKAISSDDRDFVDAALAVLSEQKPAEIRRVIRLQSAKSAVALAWMCGLSMKCAVALQQKTMRLTSTKIIRPTASGGFPMDDNDLSWQAELLFQ